MRPQTAYDLDALSKVEQEKEFELFSFGSRNIIRPLGKKLPGVKVLSYQTNIIADSFVPSLEQEQQLNKKTVPFKGTGTLPIFPKITAPPRDNFVSLQKWEGVVIELLQDSFLARLYDLTQKGPDEEAEFPLEEVSEEDKSLIMPGAIFYWNIGYHDSHYGQRQRSSIIRFRRLPSWRKEEIEASKREADRIKNSIWID